MQNVIYYNAVKLYHNEAHDKHFCDVKKVSVS